MKISWWNVFSRPLLTKKRPGWLQLNTVLWRQSTTAIPSWAATSYVGRVNNCASFLVFLGGLFVISPIKWTKILKRRQFLDHRCSFLHSVQAFISRMKWLCWTAFSGLPLQTVIWQVPDCYSYWSLSFTFQHKLYFLTVKKCGGFYQAQNCISSQRERGKEKGKKLLVSYEKNRQTDSS